MSNYNINQKFIKILENKYRIDYSIFIKLLESYNPDDFVKLYVYPNIAKQEESLIIDLSPLFSFADDDFNKLYLDETDFKLELYKIKKLLEMFEKIYKDDFKTQNKNYFNMKITFIIVPDSGFFKLFKKDNIYSYIEMKSREKLLHNDYFKDIYQILLKSFEKLEMDCSKDYIKSLNKKEFDDLMSLFDMMAI